MSLLQGHDPDPVVFDQSTWSTFTGVAHETFIKLPGNGTAPTHTLGGKAIQAARRDGVPKWDIDVNTSLPHGDLAVMLCVSLVA